MTDDGWRRALLLPVVRHRRRLIDGEPEDIGAGIVAGDVEAVLLCEYPPQVDLRREDAFSALERAGQHLAPQRHDEAPTPR
jgi:hypothetical protein